MAEMVEFYDKTRYYLEDLLNLKKGDIIFAKPDLKISDNLLPLLGIFSQSEEIPYSQGIAIIFDELVVLTETLGNLMQNKIYYSLKTSKNFKVLKKFLKKSGIKISGKPKKIEEDYLTYQLKEFYVLEKNNYKKLGSLLA